MERPRLVERLDAAAAAGQLIVFDARPGFGSRTTIRAWVARHPDWQVAWDDSRMPPDGPDEVLRRGLSVLTHLPDVTDSGGRTVLVIEDARRFVDRIELLDLAGLTRRRRDVTVVVCTAGRLERRPAQQSVEVVTDDDLAWDADLASEALARRGLALNEEQLAQLVQLCEGSPGRIVACAQLRTEYPGVSAERMYARWLHERLGRHGADRLLLALDVLGEVPVELVPDLLEVAGSSEDALAELFAEGLVERTASHIHDAVVLSVAAPRAAIAVLRTLAPARGAGMPVAEIARELASRAAPGSLPGRYWAALAGDTDAAHAYIEAVLAHPDPRAVEFVVDTRWLVMTRAAEDPAFVAACLLVEVGRGGDPRELPDAENLLRLSDDELAVQTEGARGAILASRAILLIADARPAEAVRAAEAALAQLEHAPWAERQRAARIRNAVLVTLLAALTELLDLEAADRHARAVLAAPEGDRWRISLEAAAGLALYNATLRGDLAMAELCEPFTRVREAEGARPARTVLLARYVDAMNARDLPQMVAVAKELRHGERSSRAWDLLGDFAVKDLAFRDRAPDSLAEPARDRRDLAPLPRAVALDLRARQLIEMGRPGLALRLLEGLEPDPRHIFCFVALRARALLAMGFPRTRCASWRPARRSPTTHGARVGAYGSCGSSRWPDRACRASRAWRSTRSWSTCPRGGGAASSTGRVSPSCASTRSGSVCPARREPKRMTCSASRSRSGRRNCSRCFAATRRFSSWRPSSSCRSTRSRRICATSTASSRRHPVRMPWTARCVRASSRPSVISRGDPRTGAAGLRRWVNRAPAR
nr:hypothetical protein [Homoserinibacter gongjuensis]